MNLTSKSRYALKIMIDLALYYDDGKQQRQSIAKRQGVPSDYIDHILARLRDNGLVNSLRGRNGGFVLAKPPEEISAWDIFTSAEANVHPVQCLDNIGCANDTFCGSKGVWEDLFGDFRQSLENKSLMHLVTLWKKTAESVSISHISEIRECRAPRKNAGDQTS